jgi:hypothetical protein
VERDVLYERVVPASTMPGLTVRVVAGEVEPTLMLVPDGGEPILMDMTAGESLIRALEDAYEALGG